MHVTEAEAGGIKPGGEAAGFVATPPGARRPHSTSKSSSRCCMQRSISRVGMVQAARQAQVVALRWQVCVAVVRLRRPGHRLRGASACWVTFRRAPHAGYRMCASYLNFYICNGGVVVPQFGEEQVRRADRVVYHSELLTRASATDG